MKLPTYFMLLACMILSTGCCLQQTCCTRASYYDASVFTTPMLAENDPTHVPEPPTPVAAVQPPELPVETPPDVRPLAVDEPAVQPLQEEQRPVRRAARERIVPVQLPRVSYTIEG